MRKIFSQLLHDKMAVDSRIVLLTGDLGYGLWDKIKIDFGDRFYNMGSAEQLLMGAAIGHAMEDKIPIVYSITPFLLYRPFELIRNYLDHEKIAVKLVGGGRNKDYGYLGFSHWAHDDKKIMGSFNNIVQHHPGNKEDLERLFDFFVTDPHPHYLNLKRKL